MKPYKKLTLIIIALVIVVAAWNLTLQRNSDVVVTNFEECVKAGNPIMESYPAQCIHEGKTYVQEISNIVQPDNPNYTGTPTSADNAPEGSIHNLPVPEAVKAVKAFVANNQSMDIGLVIVTTAYEAEWTDACLGLGGPAESCLAVITPGYEITVQVKGTEHKYRTNLDGSIIRREY